MPILTREERSVRPVLPAKSDASWQTEIRTAIRSSQELCKLLGLRDAGALAEIEMQPDFPVFVPRNFAARMKQGDWRDPLLRQVLALADERREVPGFDVDPVGDASASLAPGVLQKYRGRALVIATGVCAVHCRYCFRRHFPYEQAPHSERAWDAALASVAADSAINEVILSGGDPLMLVDERLARLVDKIAAIPHVERLRIHTRLPIVIPNRVTGELLRLVSETRLTTVVVVHANHAQELSTEVGGACERLRAAGATLVNQAVLLRGVNDTVEAQQQLSERLIQCGVVPYYLHQLDRVAGAAHFEVPIERGRQIIAELRERLPGYLVPRYVQEQAGEPSKTLL